MTLLPIRVRLRPRVPEAVLLRHVSLNSARSIERLRPARRRPEPAVVAAGGPSLNASLPEIRRLRRDGARILAVNEVPRHLVRLGLQPWAAVYVGPVELTTRSLGTPLPGVRYFVASICPGSTFQRLTGFPTVLWQPAVPGLGERIRTLAAAAGTGQEPLVGGGNTVTLHALTIARLLGFREIHLFGADGSASGDALHAYRSVGDAFEVEDLEVCAAGRRYLTTPALLAQAAALPDACASLAEAGVDLVLHGTGLVPDLWRHYRDHGWFPELRSPATAAPGQAFVEVTAAMY